MYYVSLFTGATADCFGNTYGTKGEGNKTETGGSEGHNGVCANSSNFTGAIAQSCH